MKAKKAMILAVIAASISTGTVSAQAHQHMWTDDISHSNETVNAYVCPCGETKYEDVASIRTTSLRWRQTAVFLTRRNLSRSTER